MMVRGPSAILFAIGIASCSMIYSTADLAGGSGAPTDAAVAVAPDAGDPIDAAYPNDGGAALQFDGVNDFVRVTRQVQDDFTLEAWIKTTSSRAGAEFYDGLPVIYADVDGIANDFGTSILNGKFSFGGDNSKSVQSTTTVTTGEWVHVAAVRVRSTGRRTVLVNGRTEANGTGSTASLVAPTTIDFGGNVIDGRYFAGTMDEVRIWNVARTEAQIQSTMNIRLAGNEAGLVGYWRFDEGTGSTATDSSPSGNTGSLGNGTTASSPEWVPSNASP